MIQVALWEPEIPPNAGNVARLCAATGASLHLVGRLGFRLDDKSLKRAGLDYWPHVDLHRHVDLADFDAWRSERGYAVDRLFCLSARASRPYTKLAFRPGDALLFGSETRGLPPEVLARHAERTFAIPMPGGAVRSLNLATAVGIVLYEGLRQLHNW